MNFTMMPTESTPRYRNYSNNMPSSVNPTPRAVPSISGVEKEPERDPEDDCFMCRQSNVYIKPIGVSQEQRVARRHPPPLSRAQIDELSQKKQLTKLEAKKLLQCFFPEIKDVKYFQLHKYHSCCYDPKHLSLCKNHITALQREREDHPHHHHDGELEKGREPQNRVSFVRIKIEPTKGIPTRFLGPAVLPESLADMLIKQVHRFENKKTLAPPVSDRSPQSYSIRRVANPHDNNNDEDEDDDDSYEDDDEEDQAAPVQRRTINRSVANSGQTNRDKQGNMKSMSTANNEDLVVEDLDELNRLYIQPGQENNENGQQSYTRPMKKKKRKKGMRNGHRHPKLKHWEKMALEQSHQEPCNCRHHVMRLAADQVVYDWCRCKDHQHRELLEKQRQATPPPEPPREPTPPPPPPPRPKPKPRKVQKKSIGINATQPATTELALAYDPSAVDYDMVQEAIYYRTSSGRLIKPEVSAAFTYDSIPPSMNIHQIETAPKKSEVLYLSNNGQMRMLESGQPARGKVSHGTSPMTSLRLTNPGSVYNGHAVSDQDFPSPKSGIQNSVPILKLTPSLTSSKHEFSDSSGSRHQPAQFTLTRTSPEKSIGTPNSRRSVTDSPGANSQGGTKTAPMSLQKSTKPTYTNQQPTPPYGRQSSVIASRRWFDQPLGDQNLRPVHDGQYGLIAGSSTEQHKAKGELLDNEPEQPITQTKDGKNCTIS